MERKRIVEGDTPIRWKKIGGGGFLFKGHLIKPGQVFTARVDEVPKGFRDVCIPLDEIPVPVEAAPIDVKVASYTIQPRGEGKVWFDVVDSNGKVMNEKALRKEVAEQYVKDLAG